MPFLNKVLGVMCCQKPRVQEDNRAGDDHQAERAPCNVANRNIQRQSPVLVAAAQIPVPQIPVPMEIDPVLPVAEIPPTVVPDPVAAGPAPYSSDDTHTLAQLIEYSDAPDFPDVERLFLAEELVLWLYHPVLSPRDRFEICASIAKCLSPAMTLLYNDKKRGDSYFANLAADIFMSASGFEKIPALKNRFIDVLSRWLNEIAPERQEFSIQGALISRDAMQQWIGELRAPSSQAEQALKKATLRNLEGIQYNRGGSQSVHDRRVIAAGDMMLQDMRKNLKDTPLPSGSSVRKEIEAQLVNYHDRDFIHSGLKVVYSHNAGVNSSSEVSTSPLTSLRTLWAYIQQHETPKVAKNLLDATMLRLAEIGRERPCFTGCVERILDIPTGIDLEIGVLSGIDFKQDVTTIAGQVQAKMEEIFEGTELENLEDLPDADDSIRADIQTAIFRNAVTVQMARLRGIPAAEFEKEVERLAPGFSF